MLGFCYINIILSCILNQIFLGEDTDEPESKKMKGSPYFVSELAYLLARCEEKMPFVFLGDEVVFIFLTVKVWEIELDI